MSHNDKLLDFFLNKLQNNKKLVMKMKIYKGNVFHLKLAEVGCF